jgi:RNA polymerase sigma-70 factor (ECF subfamily)
MQQSGGTGSSVSAAFGHTRWSLVAALRDQSVTPDRDPLEELSRSYCYPVYAYIRRSAVDPEPAWQLARRYFDWLAAEIRGKQPAFGGRFRVFLLARLQEFIASSASHPADAIPAHPCPPGELAELEQRLSREHAGGQHPATAFERSFGLQVIARSRQRLAEETVRNGREAMYAALAPYLTAEPQPALLAEIARSLGLGTLAVQLAIKHLRHRFRELVEQELAETVSSPADLEAERAALLAVLARPS